MIALGATRDDGVDTVPSMMRPRGPQRIAPYQPGSGSERADAALQGISRMFGGHIPNLHKVMARSPAMVEAFEAMRRLLQRSSLRTVEREIVSIEVARRNRCDYCMTAHTCITRYLKVSDSDLEAAKSGRPMADARLALVQRATQRLIDTRGRLSDEELESFRSAGLDDPQLVEIIAVIGWYVMSTFINNLAQTEIDDFFKDCRRKRVGPVVTAGR